MSSTVRLTLVSHAQTPAMSAAAFPRADAPLSEQGRRRAVATAALLGGRAEVLHDFTRRTRETCEAWGVSARVDAGLADLDVGAWAGRGLADLDPADLQAWHDDLGSAPHGGESVLDLLQRVRRWLDGRVAIPGSVTAVTHPAVIRAAVVCVLDCPPAMFWRVDVQPLSRTLLTSRGKAWSLVLS